MLIPPWIKWVVLLALLAAYGGGAFWLGGEHSRKVAAEDKMDKVLQFVEGNEQWHKDLDKKLSNLPKSETKIHETVRLYPAPCPMPEPVADELQAAANKANTARKVPRNP